MKANETMQSKKWIIIVAVCSLLLIACELMISHYVSSQFSESMLNQRKNSVSKIAHLAHNTIKPILYDLEYGKIDRIAAREKIIDSVRHMTYTDEYGKNYIFMSSYDGVMLVQPFESSKEGSDQWDLMDVKGKYIIRELVRAARENPEGSFVTYDYYLPTEERIEEKLSYVIGIPDINAYIGTGMYVESSYRELQRILDLQRYGFLFMILLILSASTFYILSLLKSNQALSRVIMERMYAESNIRTVFDSIHDAVMIHDSRGNILLANKSAGILYGLPEDRITDYNISQLSSEENDAELKLQLTDELKNSSLIFEWKCKRPIDGTIFDGEVALRRSKWSGEEVIVAVVRDISERKKQEAEIQHLAFYDYLTSLNNRVYIMNELQKELDKSKNGVWQGAILFIDLDNFKKINDNFGHSFGDKVLIELANKLKTLPPDQYMPARIGGDEFMILCYGAELCQAMKTADQVLNQFRESIEIYDNSIGVTCSIGIALYPKDGNTVEEIFKNADMALYSAKDQGKDGYSIFEEAMSAEMQYKTEMEDQLRHAYLNEDFLLHYQPLYDVIQKKITGYEALIRWESLRYGMVMPGKIIPLAEEIGLIDKIGEWVIDKAFAFAKFAETRNLHISCNVSPVQLSQAHFVDHVLQKFEQYQLSQGSVALEITESCLIESFDEVSKKLALLRARGILIYLDDFGTGYSSLNYLKNLPVDSIKIDKSFIEESTHSGHNSKILKAIITLAHEMGIKTVAEGVETVEQLEFLELYNCDLIQGYLISRPKPEKEIMERHDFSSFRKL